MGNFANMNGIQMDFTQHAHPNTNVPLNGPINFPQFQFQPVYPPQQPAAQQQAQTPSDAPKTMSKICNVDDNGYLTPKKEKKPRARPKKSSSSRQSIKRFECSTCLKRFTLKQNLKVHIRVHTGERPFKCKFCPKRFKDSRARINHHLTHTGEKPHECKVCSKRFGQRSSYTRHLRSQTHKSNLQKMTTDQCVPVIVTAASGDKIKKQKEQ